MSETTVASKRGIRGAFKKAERNQKLALAVENFTKNLKFDNFALRATAEELAPLKSLILEAIPSALQVKNIEPVEQLIKVLGIPKSEYVDPVVEGIEKSTRYQMDAMHITGLTLPPLSFLLNLDIKPQDLSQIRPLLIQQFARSLSIGFTQSKDIFGYLLPSQEETAPYKDMFIKAIENLTNVGVQKAVDIFSLIDVAGLKREDLSKETINTILDLAMEIKGTDERIASTLLWSAGITMQELEDRLYANLHPFAALARTV